MYANAFYAINDDMSSQVKYIIILFDKNSTCSVLDFSSCKSRPVVRSIMEAVLYAITDAFYSVRLILAGLSCANEKRIQVRMSNDSKQVIEVLTRGKRPTEKRMAIDTTAILETYCALDIESVGLS